MHRLLTDHPGEKQFMLGNEAIARGALEAGVEFATTYPGTPSSEISLNLFQISQESDLYFEYSTNEKVALEVAAGAASSGLRTMCIMKHVGLNVAADPFVTLAYLGITGALVVLTADDPAMFSSQNEQDNRYYSRLAGLPMLEPSSVAEAKEMTIHAFDLSAKLKSPVLLRTTTRINHSSAVVSLDSITTGRTQGDFNKDPFSLVIIPAVSRKLHVNLLEKLKQAHRLSESSRYNFTRGAGQLGIICSGVSYAYVEDGVADLSAEAKIRILRLGMSHPLPDQMIQSFLSQCSKILVVEEGEPVLEESVKAIAQESGLTLPIKGKGDNLFSRLSEFHPAMVREVIAQYFNLPYSSASPIELSDLPEAPQRPPSLCAGCSHRATFFAVKKATEGMDTIFPSDIGCYTLGILPPLSMADYAICMGSSVSSACGFSKATDKRVVAFIGDSTFFHSGITGLVNAVFNNHKFTLVILDNRTTAMTGHQPHPGVDQADFNLPPEQGQISIEALVRALGVKHVSVIKPYKVAKSIAAIKAAIEFDGVSVVISEEMCALFAKGLKRLSRRPFTVTAKCKNHHDCINEIACPAFFLEGDQVRINPTTCVGCALCAQICPENAILRCKAEQQG